MPDRTHLDRYLPMVRELAEKALGMAVDASPTRARAGEAVVSLLEAVPAARARLGHDAAAWSPADDDREGWTKGVACRVVDGLGHTRLVYHYLYWGLLCEASVSPSVVQAACIPDPDGQVHHEACAAWCRYRAGVPVSWSPAPTDTGVVHLQTAEDAPDAWVYREMVALHAAFGMWSEGYEGLRESRLREAASYHLQHTQPDYTTYQPWALAAFLYFPETVPFGEQQLHDVATHLSVEGPPGALVPGLLLADAWATLNGLRGATPGDVGI